MLNEPFALTHGVTQPSRGFNQRHARASATRQKSSSAIKQGAESLPVNSPNEIRRAWSSVVAQTGSRCFVASSENDD